MRRRDTHDDPPARRRPTPYRGPPVTLGYIRSHGVRHLLIYRSTGLCYHSAIIDADRWPDDTVLLDPDRRAVCTKCGIIGADGPRLGSPLSIVQSHHKEDKGAN
jgi:hypothetical protein